MYANLIFPGSFGEHFLLQIGILSAKSIRKNSPYWKKYVTLPNLSQNSVYQGSHCSTYIMLLSSLCVNYLRRLYDYSDESYIWTRFSQLLLNINICQKIKILISWVCHDAKVPDTTTILGSFCSQSSFFVILCEPRKKNDRNKSDLCYHSEKRFIICAWDVLILHQKT